MDHWPSDFIFLSDITSPWVALSQKNIEKEEPLNLFKYTN